MVTSLVPLHRAPSTVRHPALLRLWRRLVRGLQLPVEQQATTAEAALQLLLIRLAVRVLPLRVLLPLRSTPDVQAARLPEKAQLDATIADCVWALERSSSLLNQSNCLVRALSLRNLLQRRGIATHLSLGVRRTDARALVGHAWLSCAGRVLVGGDDLPTRYKVIQTP